MENTEIEPTENQPEPPKSPGSHWVRVLTVLYVAAIVIGVLHLLRKPAPQKSAEWFGPQNVFKKSSIVIVPVTGVITVSDQGGLFMPQSADRIVRRLRSLSEQEEVKAVVLRVNSPGGSVGAVQEIYDEILHLKQAGKKVVVSMGDVAASGGYYIAAAADHILADPGTLTGSIGVIFQVGNFQELFKKIGVKMDAIKSAEHKDIGSPFRTMTEQERKILQALIDEAYQQFVDAIVQGRKMKKEDVLALADGRIFTGSQAKSSGLIDELGNMQKAIAKAAELAGLKEKPRVLYEEEPWNKLFSIFSESTQSRWMRAWTGERVRFAYLWELGG